MGKRCGANKGIPLKNWEAEMCERKGCKWLEEDDGKKMVLLPKSQEAS